MNNTSPSLVLSTDRGIKRIALDNLVRIEAMSNYSRLHFGDGKALVVARVLGKFKCELSGHFFRVHHKHLVNLHWVQRFRPVGQQAVLTNGEVLPVSRRKAKATKQAFLRWVEQGAAA